MGVGLINLVDPSDTLNYICCLYLCGTKSVVQKTDPRLTLVCFGVIFVYSIKGYVFLLLFV